MKKARILSLLMGLAALLAACENSENEGPEGPEPCEQVGRTVLVYIVGGNGASELPSLSKVNFSDMKAGMEKVDYPKCNLVVYSGMVDDVPHLISLKQKSDKVVADTPFTYDERNPLDKEIMASVISQTISYFLADSYGFVLLSHSLSWVPASNNTNSRPIGYYRRTQMNISDSREISSSALPKSLKFILSDSCSMQSVEVAYGLRDYAEYFISFPTEIPGSDALYRVVVPEMFTGTNLATNIAEAYYGYYEKSYTGATPVSNENQTGGVATSVIKSAVSDNLVAVTKTIIPRHIRKKREVDRNDILAYGFNGDVDYDFEKLIRNLTDGINNTDYRSQYTVLETTVVYGKITLRDYSGIIHRMFAMEGPEGFSTYIPTSASNSTISTFYHILSWCTTAEQDGTGW